MSHPLGPIIATVRMLHRDLTVQEYANICTEQMTYEKKLRELAFFSLEKRWLKRDPFSVFISVIEKMKPDSSCRCRAEEQGAVDPS